MYSINHIATAFDRGIERALSTHALFNYISGRAPGALRCDDLLRGALVTCSSAFDLLHHHLFRTLINRRLRSNTLSSSFNLPASILHLDLEAALLAIDRQITINMSTRSYLQPDKIAELYSPVIADYWPSFAILAHEASKDIKARIRELARWRNRIVHESDINPDLLGIEEWPVFSIDVANAITDYKRYGDVSIQLIEANI